MMTKHNLEALMWSQNQFSHKPTSKVSPPSRKYAWTIKCRKQKPLFYQVGLENSFLRVKKWQCKATLKSVLDHSRSRTTGMVYSREWKIFTFGMFKGFRRHRKSTKYSRKEANQIKKEPISLLNKSV